MGYPGWDSLNTVTRIHNVAEVLGIVFLGLLVVAEIVSFKSGHRQSELAEAQQQRIQNQHESDMARLHKETAEAKAQSAIANATRNLTEEQSQTIIASLRDKISIKVKVQSDRTDMEAYPFAQQIFHALKSANVDVEYEIWPTTFMWLTEPGVFVVTAGKVDEKQTALVVEALNVAGLNVKKAMRPEEMSPQPPNPGWVSVLVWKQR